MRVIPLLDRRKEGIDVGVQNRRFFRHEHMFARPGVIPHSISAKTKPDFKPHATDDPGAKPLNDATKYVASRSHPTLEWSNSVLLEGDAAEAIAALKKEHGPELQVHGSGALIQKLLRRNLPGERTLAYLTALIPTGR